MTQMERIILLFQESASKKWKFFVGFAVFTRNFHQM